jgi:SAM-dependent methyltransferase
VNEYSAVRYLLAKQTVDDRALNRQVLDALCKALVELAPDRPRILEIGAGAGTMLPRLHSWGILNCADYTLLDRESESLAGARAHLTEAGALVRPDGVSLRWTPPEADFDVHLVHADAFAHLAALQPSERYDVVIANAVLDLMDVKVALPQIWRGVVPGGLYWFSINFDGETIFLPELELDPKIMALYHQTMDERVRDGLPAGDSRCGRHLLMHLPQSGARVLAAGSSDWVVFASNGVYPADEAYFLDFILNGIDDEVGGLCVLEANALADWVGARRAHLERGELVYIAHQLDVFGLSPG